MRTTKEMLQFIGELGAGPNLNRLAGEIWDDALRTLLEEATSLIKGDHVAFVVGRWFENRFGVVVANDGKMVTVATAGDGLATPRTCPINAFSGGWSIGDPTPRAVPISRGNTRLANRLLRSSGLVPGRFVNSRPGEMSWYVISELRREAGLLGKDLGFDYPGAADAAEDSGEAVVALTETLPGDGEGTSTMRGYVGWGPYCDCARTVELDGVENLLDALRQEGIAVHDFYFQVRQDKVECPCCAGSGTSRDVAELDAGFYAHGGGRWGGWGAQLRQQEIDALVEQGRIRAPDGVLVTEENYGSFLGMIELDSISQAIITPIRAAHLGLDTQACSDCHGEGEIPISPYRITLNVWAGIPFREVDVVFKVEDVTPEDIEDVRALMAHHGSGLLERLRVLEGSGSLPISTVAARTVRHGDGWRADREFDTWTDFIARFAEVDDYNLPLGFAFAGKEEHSTADAIPEDGRMAIFLSFPRKGATCTVFIESVSERDRGSMVQYFAKVADIHERHFDWALGRGIAPQVPGR